LHQFRRQSHTTWSASMDTRSCWRKLSVTSIPQWATRITIQQQRYHGGCHGWHIPPSNRRQRHVTVALRQATLTEALILLVDSTEAIHRITRFRSREFRPIWETCKDTDIVGDIL
jgi:hypothetical protein